MKPNALVASSLVLVLCACASSAPSPAAPPAQEPGVGLHEPAPATEQHRWLGRFLGEWRSEARMPGGDGSAEQTMQGSESARAIGDLWIVSEVRGSTPAGDMEAVLTLGYDPEKARFVGTWVDSMTAHMWVYEGGLDASGKSLELDSKGPSFSGDGTLASYRDVFTFESDDHKVLTSFMQGPDGGWVEYLKVDHRRKK